MQKPFLKWLGGKTRLIGDIKKLLPQGNRLVEPFVGSCSIFLNIEYNEYLLADSNEDLINLYLALQNKGRQFIEASRAFFTSNNNTKEQYMVLRDEFNKTKDPSLFVYLNRHCFNGLCRYNSKGEFNTPFGEYANPVHFPAKEMLFFVERCRSKKVEFIHSDFRDTMKKARSGDVFYADPPYAPISLTSSFSSYDSGGFSVKDQGDLVSIASGLSVPVLISNNDTEYTSKLYNKASYIKKISAGRFIGGDRKSVIEILALFNSDYKEKTLWSQ